MSREPVISIFTNERGRAIAVRVDDEAMLPDSAAVRLAVAGPDSKAEYVFTPVEGSEVCVCLLAHLLDRDLASPETVARLRNLLSDKEAGSAPAIAADWEYLVVRPTEEQLKGSSKSSLLTWLALDRGWKVVAVSGPFADGTTEYLLTRRSARARKDWLVWMVGNGGWIVHANVDSNLTTSSLGGAARFTHAEALRLCSGGLGTPAPKAYPVRFEDAELIQGGGGHG